MSLKFATVNHLTLSYRQAGSGSALLFLNSLGTDHRVWDPLLPHFASAFHLIQTDKRGHGLSDAPPGPYAIADLAADAVGLLDHLGVTRAVVIGDSVGGLIALQMAAAAPARVAGLVVCDTAAKIGTRAYWDERITRLHQHGLEPLADGILERWFSPAFLNDNPAAVRGYGHMLTRTPLAGYIAVCEAIRDADLRPYLPQISGAVQVVCGREDRATPPEVVKELADQLPNSRFDLIDNAGHIPSIEQPAALTAVIHRYLKEIGYE